MGIAMSVGSFIAGSTPFGGGIVAFPVAVLVLKLPAQASKDFTVLIQSFGMTAASFLLMLKRPEALVGDFILTGLVAGTVGVVIGVRNPLPPFYVMLLYTISTAVLSVVFGYIQFVVRPLKAAQTEGIAEGEQEARTTCGYEGGDEEE